LRAAGLRVDVYPEPAKSGKMFFYADKRKIPFVTIQGSRERQTNVVGVKDMTSGVQQDFSRDAVVAEIRNTLSQRRTEKTAAESDRTKRILTAIEQTKDSQSS
jgi:histidyl-tRNA synthetase